MYTLAENAPLAARTTIRVPASARWLAEVRDEAALPEVMALPQASGDLLVLGEGSNVLFTRDYPGLVVCPELRGITDDGDGRVQAGAGENWHEFVHWSLSRGYTGLENLALIPGTVGAAPIQNIGAYGTELDGFVHAVRVWDRQDGRFVTLTHDECAFAYRDSALKQSPDRYLVTRVEFTLPRDRPLALDYAGVREELSDMGIDTPTHADVARAVERIRRRKLPDPDRLANVGSFFKNPIIDSARADVLRGSHVGMPTWPAGDGMSKLSAAWLIERCGLKGVRDGDAGVSEGHALVLVNHGSATGAQLWALAGRVRDAVEARFGIRLEPEPRIL